MNDTLIALLADRRSTRAFLSEPVADETINAACALAQSAPSNCNTQPWIVRIVSGETRDRLATALSLAAGSGETPFPDLPMSAAYAGVYRTRQIDSAKALFAACGVARENLAGRREAFLRNFQFFGAPHAAFLFLPDCFGIYEAADVGIFAATFMLSLRAYGIECCAQGALGQYASIVREQLGVPIEDRLLFGISFGFPDPADPVNTTETLRAPITQSTHFHR